MWDEGIHLPWSLARNVLNEAAAAADAPFLKTGAVFTWRGLPRVAKAPKPRVRPFREEPIPVTVFGAVRALVPADGVSEICPAAVIAQVEAMGVPMSKASVYRALHALSGDTRYEFLPSHDLVRLGHSRYRLATAAELGASE